MLDGGWTRPEGGVRGVRQFWILHLGCIQWREMGGLGWAAPNHGHVGEDSDGVRDEHELCPVDCQ